MADRADVFMCFSFVRRTRLPVAALAVAVAAFSGSASRADEPLRVAVYDIPPYGYVMPDGSISGVSVELWRRVAERIERQYRLTPVSDMEALLGGLEQGRFDAAIGAITITPDRADRVAFSYPAHRSGVAVAFRRDGGPLSALRAYGAALAEFSPLLVIILAMLLTTGLAMWWIEKSQRSVKEGSETSVTTLRDGLYWAVVTMTTVGYGDKTPKTTVGRVVAVLWMLGSLVLVSLLSTSLVSRLTADRVESDDVAATVDLAGKRLGAVTLSSGAEYLDERRLPYTKYKDLAEALAALADGRSDAVVNSVGALQYFVAQRYARVLRTPRGLLAPAYMAIDRALMRITGEADWRSREDSYFER